MKKPRLLFVTVLVLIPRFVIAEVDLEKRQQQLMADDKKAILGAQLFHDTSLSNPPGQSCASCHKPDKVFSDGLVVSEGATKGVFGRRNTPMLTYAKYAIPFHKFEFRDRWAGGFFWDGRAATLEDQALGPLFNPLEMNTTQDALAEKLRSAAYAKQIAALFGKEVLESDWAMVRAAAIAIANFERTDLFSPFSSKYDYVKAGKATFTDLEAKGEMLFQQQGQCSECHQGASYDGRELFTSYDFHNIMLPKNRNSPFFLQKNGFNADVENFVDVGLAANEELSRVYADMVRGQFRTPSLRNIELTAPYMHNGIFNTLEEVMAYYAANGSHNRKLEAAEVPENRSSNLPESLDINQEDVKALIAFMLTLTDGYEP